MKRRSIKLLRKSHSSEIRNLETNLASACLQAPRVDEENPRTKKFASSLLSEIPMPFASLFGIRTKQQEWRSIKTIPAIPTFMDMSNETRTRILHVVYSFGAAPSSVLCRLVGLTARQVGQIRRWNIPNWRDLTNQHINRANNYARVTLARR